MPFPRSVSSFRSLMPAFFQPERFLGVSLSLLPIVAALVPRFLAFAPGLIALITIILLKSAQGRWPVLPKPYLWLVSGALAFCAASAFWSFDALTTLERTLKIALVLASGVALFAVIRALPSTTGVLKKILPYTMCIAGAMIALDLFAQGAFYRALRPGLLEQELNYSHINRSVLSYALILVPFLGLMREEKKRAALTIIPAALGALLLFGTESQSAQLAVIVALVFFLFFPVRVPQVWAGLCGLLILGLSLAPWLAMWMFQTLAAQAKTMPWLTRGYAAERMEIWDFIARKILENPLNGFGLDATRDIAHFETKNLYNPVDHVLHPHNFALQIWIEFGALGVGFAAAFVAVLLKIIHDQPAFQRRVFLCLFMAVLLSAATSYGLWQAWWLGLFCTLCAYCAALAAPIEKDP